MIKASDKFLFRIKKASKLSRLQCIRRARKFLIEVCQRAEYRKIVSFLMNPRKMKEPSIVQQLLFYLDSEGLIRCLGRMKNVDSNSDSACSILLTRNTCLTKLIITYVHCKSAHFGKNIHQDCRF